MEILDGYWKDKLTLFSKTSVDYVFDKLVEQGSIQTYQNVIDGIKKGENNPWQESMLLETIRAASDFLLVEDKNSDYYKNMVERIDGYIDVIYQASMTSETGHLSTHAMAYAPGLHFDANGNANWYHEAYNFGCLCESAVHYYQATGDTKLLYVACRFAEYLVDNYGYGLTADGEKKINMVCAHSIAEEALLTMYQLLNGNEELITKIENTDTRYILDIDPDDYADLVKFWIENHGNYDNRINNTSYGVYAQDAQYYFDQDKGVGHAVRANLYYTGIAAAGLEFMDYTYLESVDRIVTNIVDKQMYITGAVGAIGANEAYGDNYVLPTDGYAETCAASAFGFANQYLLKAFGQSKYADIVETEMYNGVLGSAGLDGKTFSYVNPLNTSKNARWSWHSCPCCPPMILKFYSQLQTYIYAYTDDSVYINQFVDSKATLDNGVTVTQQTDMPWGGTTTLTIGNKATELHLRVPAWAADGNISVKVNDKAVDVSADANGYIVLDVNAGDVVVYELPLTAKRVYANENVAACEGKVALTYGPIVYCLETVDNPGGASSSIDFAGGIPNDAVLTATYNEDLLGGVVTISTVGETASGTQANYTAVPYYARANRGAAGSFVWINEEVVPSGISAKDYLASCTSIREIGQSPTAAFDGNSETKWTAGNSVDVQYLLVDLGEEMDIGKVTATFGSTQAWRFNVLYSNDTETWTTFDDFSENLNAEQEFTATGEAKARYVALEFLETPVGYISIHEMQVFAPDGTTNLALNKMCGASSCFNNGESPFALVDGLLGTRYVANGVSKPQSVTMDMGEKVDITGMTINFEKETDWTYNIQVSDDGKTWTTYYEETYRCTDREITKSGSGRYVKFEITATTGRVWACAWELDIHTATEPESVMSRLKNHANNDAADKAAAKTVTDQIAALGAITSLDQKSDVEAARTAYDNLTEEQKAYVTNLDVLTAAEAKITELQAAADKEAADKAAAETVTDQIAALGAITSLEQKSDVEAARTAYNNLTEDQKGYVTNLVVLTAAEAKITELQAAADKEAADQAAADEVEALIDAIGRVTIGSKQKIKAARDAYDALTDTQKAMVDNYDVLVAAEASYRKQMIALGATIAGGAASEPAAEFPFVDVPVTAWYYDEVKEAWENDLIDGMNEKQYMPDNTLTVAQAIKLAAALHQMYYKGEVTLTNGVYNWYDSYVDYAVANRIIEAKYDNYTLAQMNTSISREEFVHIFFGAMNMDAYYACNSVAANAIPDVKMNDTFADEIYTFYRAGILTGSDAKGTFNPESSIKRSEVAAILIRMYDTNARQSISLS